MKWSNAWGMTMIDLIYSNLSFMNHAYSKHTKVNIASAHAICLKFTLLHETPQAFRLVDEKETWKNYKPRFRQQEFHWLIKRSLRDDPVWNVVRSCSSYHRGAILHVLILILLIKFGHRHLIYSEKSLYSHKFLHTQ